MEATLSLNSRGVITLPAKMRQLLGLKSDDLLIAQTTPEGILLRPTVTLPLERYSDARVAEFDVAESELAAVFAKYESLTSTAKKTAKPAKVSKITKARQGKA